MEVFVSWSQSPVRFSVQLAKQASELETLRESIQDVYKADDNNVLENVQPQTVCVAK